MPELHKVENDYGSISRAPQQVVARIQKIAAPIRYENGFKEPHRSKKMIDEALSKLDTSKMTLNEIQLALNADEKFTFGGRAFATRSSVYGFLNKRGLKRREGVVRHD
ncbi:hypothetical protein FD25_GL000180 [Levilactobacillus acidifarinae DSM 19394]|uniref:Uncharacterized protein n=2 Tax=Levilactobacillus acidifarinae TaxID=267364 RepID=A0A0R1LF50_9LACO|nr:hypothetical protein FD25_GL000180 [Levilactobacillus acidifarinae DSM 19394]